ncbi:hypothetical protein D3C78_759720 [compost metagenome]
MLRGAGDADGEVDVRADELAGHADLAHHRDHAGVDRRQAAAEAAVQAFGQFLEQGEALFVDPAAAGNHDARALHRRQALAAGALLHRQRRGQRGVQLQALARRLGAGGRFGLAEAQAGDGAAGSLSHAQAQAAAPGGAFGLETCLGPAQRAAAAERLGVQRRSQVRGQFLAVGARRHQQQALRSFGLAAHGVGAGQCQGGGFGIHIQSAMGGQADARGAGGGRAAGALLGAGIAEQQRGEAEAGVGGHPLGGAEGHVEGVLAPGQGDQGQNLACLKWCAHAAFSSSSPRR